jgi:hypothetical protein
MVLVGDIGAAHPCPTGRKATGNFCGVWRGDLDERRIASPKSVPKEQCRCLTRMFSIASPVVPEI